MSRNAILFDINETVLNLALLHLKFKNVFDDESVAALWFSKLLHTSTVCSLSGLKSNFVSLAEEICLITLQL